MMRRIAARSRSPPRSRLPAAALADQTVQAVDGTGRQRQPLGSRTPSP